jgi:hypothetical protein
LFIENIDNDKGEKIEGNRSYIASVFSTRFIPGIAFGTGLKV